jgi:hypothetical protein
MSRHAAPKKAKAQKMALTDFFADTSVFLEVGKSSRADGWQHLDLGPTRWTAFLLLVSGQILRAPSVGSDT